MTGFHNRDLRALQTVQTLNPERGGLARAVISLSKGLQQHGVQTEIVALDKSDSPWLRGHTFAVHALGEGLTNYRYSRALPTWLRENGNRFDCVVVHGIWQHHSFAVWQRFHKTAIPYFVFPHGMLDPWFKRTFRLKHLKKWLYWPWGDYRVLRDTAAVIFTSEEERLRARQSFWLYRAKEKISPLGIEEPHRAGPEARNLFLAKFPEIEKTRMLLFLGRIHPTNGCDLAIDALPRRASEEQVTLVLGGPDQDGWTQQLRQRVARMDIAPRVTFAGMLQGPLKRGAFENADAFILPSHREDFEIAVIEALSFGLPVLISDRVSIWREIVADHAGYVEPDDLAGTTRLIERWLHTSPDEQDLMRVNARNCFLRRFEINRAAASLLAILQAH
jgi:glycosyltransferase involved in cell wall biosynthesis